jgi:predicted nucleotidyltransferase
MGCVVICSRRTVTQSTPRCASIAAEAPRSSGRPRGDDAEGSDIDLLVEFEPDSSFFDVGHLTDELEALLGCKADVISRDGLRARDQQIVRDAVPL